MKNLKRTLTILLCYIFVVMMLPVNLMTQIVQASTSDIPDYSNVLENGYVVSAVYKDEAILLKGGFNGYDYYKNGEIISSSSDEIFMDMYRGGITNIVEINLRDTEKLISYDFNTKRVTDLGTIAEEIENILLKPYIDGELYNTSISVIPSYDEQKWYMIGASVTNGIDYNRYELIIDESYTNIIDVSNSEAYGFEKCGDLFVGSGYHWNGNEDTTIIETISLDGTITNVNISELDGKDYIRRGKVIYTYNENKVERYEIIDNNLVLINSINLGKYQEMSSDGDRGMISTIDANNNFWFIAKENNKVGLYKVDNNSVVKKYLINEKFLSGATKLSIYDDNNIVICDFGNQKHVVIQNMKNSWKQEDGNWYYYNSNGKKATGWLDLNGIWYYFNTTGVMQTGWQQIDGRWYYFNESGAMSTGWKGIDGSWYYLNASGDMATGWLNDNGTWYYLNNSGAMVTNWHQIDGSYYHFNTSGMMSTGWLDDNGKWYCLNNSGAMLTGWQQVYGTWYYFDNSGLMQTGWVNLGGTWYYLNDSGAMLTGWQQMDGIWYYFDNSGAMQTGWAQVNGTWYYLYDSGAMATNTVIDGWYIDWSGVATPQ